MTTEAENHIGHYFLLTLIGLGIWLPISGIALCIYVLQTASNLGMGALTVVGTIFSLLGIEFVATGMLLCIFEETVETLQKNPNSFFYTCLGGRPDGNVSLCVLFNHQAAMSPKSHTQKYLIYVDAIFKKTMMSRPQKRYSPQIPAFNERIQKSPDSHEPGLCHTAQTTIPEPPAQSVAAVGSRCLRPSGGRALRC
ncbi:putative membrane protein [Pseudomonas syringae pv. syringae]|nr:putative membrane protein [Pseudomonas syringae pv. syringae]